MFNFDLESSREPFRFSGSLPCMSQKLNYNSTFRPDSTNHSLNACLGYNICEWGTIARGFQAAANNLVTHVGHHEPDLDGMIYPIAFLFRHAIETTLKIAIVSTGTESVPPTNHFLLEMWDRMQPNVSKRFASDPAYLNLSEVRDILKDFESIDRSSMAFRYPTQKDGNTQLQGIDVINVGVLSERANRLIELLDRIIGAFS